MSNHRLMACLLENEPTSYSVWQGYGRYSRSRSESECEEREQSHGVDPKPGELPMVRLKGE